MALKFGPQWLRDLTDVGAGSGVSLATPSQGFKFKLADYRYGREEMLALYSESFTPPDQLRKHQAIFSKENLRPISMTPYSEDEQRLMSHGINSHVVLRGGRGGGISDRGRGRGRGRGESYIPRQSENGEQSFVRSNDGWEQVGARKPERTFPRGFDDPTPAKREYLRSNSNNWRDKKPDEQQQHPQQPPQQQQQQHPQQQEEEDNSGQWRANRENSRWGSSRPNWRQASADMDSDNTRGPRRISESYDNEVPEWAGDDVGDDPGTFDSRGMFVSTRLGNKENYIQDRQRGNSDGSNMRKKPDKRDEADSREGASKGDPDKCNETRPRTASDHNLPVQRHNGAAATTTPHSNTAHRKPDSFKKPEGAGFPKHSNKGDGDSDSGAMYREKNPSPLATNDAVNSPGSGYHPPLLQQTENIPPKQEQQQPSIGLEHTTRTSMAESDNLLHMQKSLQNLLAGLTASPENKTEEEVDVSKGALPLTHVDANKWFYRDPQNQIQGPFDSESMAEWFRIGYFTMNLIVKRGCDDSFKPLGELIKQYGRVPFVPGPPLPPLITSTSLPDPVVTAAAAPGIPGIPVLPPTMMTMPSLVTPMMPGAMGHPTMPSLHDRFMFRSMMLQQEYLKQTLLMQQVQMQTLAKLQEQETFKDYTPDQQHEIVMRMMMQNNPLLMQQIQQLQHQQVLLQQQQQQSELLSNPGLGLDAGGPNPFQQPIISHPSMQHIPPTNPLPSSTSLQSCNSSTTTTNIPASEQQEPVSVWSGSPHTDNSIWSQPPSVWDMDSMNETARAHIEKIKREREEEEERIRQELLKSKQEELRKQQSELERQREQVRREKEELEKQRQKEKMEQVRREEERLAQLDMERQRMEKDVRKQEEKKRQDEEKRRERELKKQEEKRRKEEEQLLMEEQKRLEELRRHQEMEELRRRQEMERVMDAKRQEEQKRQMEQQQIQEEEERMKKEIAEKEKQEVLRKQQIEMQRQQESIRKLQHAQNEQLAKIQLPASSNWAKHASHQGGVGHSKSLTEIQEEEARRERELQKEVMAQKERVQEQAVVYQHQQIQAQKSWASTASKGVANRGLSLLDIQQQEKENVKKSEKAKAQNQQQPKPASLGSGSGGGGGNWTGTPSSSSASGLWGTNSNWESPAPAPAPAGSAGIWDMGIPQSIKKASGKSGNSIVVPQAPSQQQQSKKSANKGNKKAAAPAPAKPKPMETVQKLFQNKKRDGFSEWVSDKLLQFSSNIDIPTFVSFIVEVDSPDDVSDYVKTYLGDTRETQDFSRQFVEKRNQHKNQMRLQKQLEEDSIWGPAPAINPRSATYFPEGSKAGTTDGSQGTKSKNKKKKKAQKLDGSILGFTVHADSNRKNAGELESIE